MPNRRLASLDAFRGFAIVGMILVNSPGNSHAYFFLRHAAWNGWTPADFVFPAFLVIMGAALVMSLRRRVGEGSSRDALLRRALRRSSLIFALGFISNLVLYEPAQGLRVMGVLQRIALCDAACAFLFLYSDRPIHAIAAAALLGGYWLLIGNDTSPQTNLACEVDRWLMGGHLYAPNYDPEGLLSTISATGTAMMGVLAGEFLSRRRERSGRGERFEMFILLAAGLAAMGAGWVWSRWMPLNKHLWTSSYALLTGGMAIAVFAVFYAVIEIAGRHSWSRPLETLGRNPLLSYMFGGTLYGALEFVHWKKPLCAFLLSAWLPPKAASAAYALLIALATWAVAAELDRRRIYLRL